MRFKIRVKHKGDPDNHSWIETFDSDNLAIKMGNRIRKFKLIDPTKKDFEEYGKEIIDIYNRTIPNQSYPEREFMRVEN